jgi:subtilisin family serine protease
MSGTSMASPHVAGVVARYYQQNPSYSPADIRAWLATDADRPGIAPLDSPTNGYTYDGVREGVVQAP